MSRGYGKYRGRGSSHHSSFHFDSLFKENANKPSAAKSAATVGKWGITSFTSIRTLNGRTGEDASGSAEAPKPKKFFKSRNSDSTSDSTPYTSPPSNSGKSTSKKAKITYDQPVKEKPTSPKKFFSSKKTTRSTSVNSEKSILTSSACSNSKTAAGGGDASKPPIVLRICHGKSQLVNDSDESEKTPTPSSTPSTSTGTSPRALRESTTRPSNCRITRSARRSMQSDPGSSPAAADTPSEFVYTATSKKDQEDPNDLSPQYIPAEKYELERKAMYDSLLKPDSPKMDLDENDHDTDFLKSQDIKEDCQQDDPKDETGSIFEEDDKENETEEILLKPLKEEENEVQEESIEAIQKEVEIIQGSKKMETDDSLVNTELQKQQENGAQDDDSVDCEFDEPLDVVPPSIPPLFPKEAPPSTTSSVTELPQIAKRSIDEDWSSDEDSNSTAPEMEVKQVQETDPAHNTIHRHKEQILDKILEKPPEPPPVKLVISKKKGSIFKSRALTQEDGIKKRTRARYVHKWIDDKDKVGGETPARTSTNNDEPSELDFDFKDEPLSRVVKKVDEDTEINSVQCAKSDKNFYMVVRNVKTSHQIQEIGEFQEFNDDVEYILDALQDNNPISTRCLSAITLASKCMAPAFRMHVRAHGVVAKFFKALHDATKDQSLGLCTATVMFVLSQDRLNMDLDRDCLELMLNLLESDVSYQQALDVCGLSTSQLEKNKEKVKELCAEIQSKGHAMHLHLENITTGQLAMETLLSLTSKRAGEWFKEELRELGGLEHIMKTIYECCKQVSDYVVSWTDVLLHKLKKVDRCLRVLENVTQNNEENQAYILRYNNGTMIDTLVSLYKLCDGEIPLYPVIDISDKTSTGAVIREALLVTLKVLINLTHHFTNKQSLGSQLIGLRPGIIDTSLHLLLQVPNYIPEQKKFELGVLVLMLLINLIQDQDVNKKLLMAAKAPSKQERLYSRDESAVEALIIQFYEWESCAKVAESKTDAILDGEKDGEEKEKKEKKTTEEFIEETVAKLLQKAGTHMEYTFLASYIVMLVGFLIMDNLEYQNNLRQFLRGATFVDMVELLKKFYKFMNLTASTEASSVCAVKTTQRVIKFLEECDEPQVDTELS